MATREGQVKRVNLNDGPIPILAWIGPSREQITPKTMSDLAAAGFNLSFSFLTPDKMMEQLDMAHAAGIRLIIGLPELSVGPGDFTAKWRSYAKRLVARVKDHPGLYGYFVVDEPRSDRHKDVCAAMRFLAELDPNHLPYCNLWSVNMGFAGFRSYEEQWDRYIEDAQPWFVSVDGYPFSAVSEEEWRTETGRGNPCYFPRHRAKIHAHYFEMLDVVRQYSRILKLPFWHCVLSVGGYSNAPEIFHGEIRFQVMVSLAYGVQGIQYFSYAEGNMLMGADLNPTANWHIVKDVNRVVRTWEPTLKKLRSIGVYHYPHNMPYTRPLDMFFLGHKNDLFARGDPCVVGQFVDEEGWEYALIVNRTPYEPAVVKFHFGTDGEVLELSALNGKWVKPWPFNPRQMALTFEPGQGRLFRYKREIPLAPVG
jgi:hypothetical protein